MNNYLLAGIAIGFVIGFASVFGISYVWVALGLDRARKKNKKNTGPTYESTLEIEVSKPLEGYTNPLPHETLKAPVPEGSGCYGCPFECTEASEQAQNWGCLPEPKELVVIKEKTGHNWSCHGDPKKICTGYRNWIKKYRPDLNVEEGGLIDSKQYIDTGVAVVEKA